MARLNEICSLNMGQSPDSSSYNENGDGLPFFQGNADFGELHPKVRIWCNAPTKIAHSGDILISVRAPIGALNIADRECCIGRGLAALTVDETFCNSRYLWYAIANKVDELNSKGTGSTFKAISKNVLGETEIPLPSLDRQQHISVILDKLSNLISRRKQQLAKLDELVKARFVEIFGDESRFDVAPLRENTQEMFIGPFGSSLKNDCFVSAENGFCMVYEQKHAIQKTMDVKTRYVSEQKYMELKRFTVRGGDIIVSCRGTIGEIYAVPDDAPFGIMHPSIMKLRLNKSAYLKNYFVFALEQYMRKHRDEANGSGIKMAVTATTLGQEMFIVPPMYQQKEFSNFVEKIRRQKLTIQQSLDKLEVLKKSLMQEYFG